MMTAYKQTELGLIPSDWEVVALGMLARWKCVNAYLNIKLKI